MSNNPKKVREKVKNQQKHFEEAKLPEIVPPQKFEYDPVGGLVSLSLLLISFYLLEGETPLQIRA